MAEIIPMGSDQVEQEAFAWVQRKKDGLAPDQEVDFRAWLYADPRHREAFALYQKGWERFEPLVELVTATGSKLESFEPGSATFGQGGAWRRAVRFLLPYAAMAACLAVAFALWSRNTATVHLAAVTLPALCEQRVLDDGSEVELNRNAQIEVEYTPTERRVKLLHGEAHFTVAKDKDRPFIVSAGGVSVRAVGTAFNVRLDSTAVNVVVTEGKVRVDPPRDAASSGPAPEPSYVEIGQKTTVPLIAAPSPGVVTLASAQLEQELLWQPRLLDFDNASLTEIVAEFNRRNPVHLVIENEATGARRMTANFRSDNVEGFVRLLESDFKLRAERVSGQEILLKQK